MQESQLFFRDSKLLFNSFGTMSNPCTFADGRDQDQTAENVQSELESKPLSDCFIKP